MKERGEIATAANAAEGAPAHRRIDYKWIALSVTMIGALIAFLSALRKVEKKSRLRAEWTTGNTTTRFFEYVPKGTRKRVNTQEASNDRNSSPEGIPICVAAASGAIHEQGNDARGPRGHLQPESGLAGERGSGDGAHPEGTPLLLFCNAFLFSFYPAFMEWTRSSVHHLR